MRDAALVAAALERRTNCRTAVVDDIMASWLTNLRATRLEIERDRTAPLSEQLESLFAWLLDVLQGNRYFVEQWKVFPADWTVRTSGRRPSQVSWWSASPRSGCGGCGQAALALYAGSPVEPASEPCGACHCSGL